MANLPSGNYLDLSGETKGLVTVHKYIFTHNNLGAVWYCTYKSGRGALIATRVLNGDNFVGKRLLPPIESAARRLRAEYKYRDKKRHNGNFNISPYKFRELTSQDCHYCGQKPQSKMNRRTEATYIYNGLDRINSDKGYTVDNVVPCCRTCNIMKSDLTVKEFKEQVKKINENFVS